MKKESVIILAIVVFVAGFIVGAISGIKFYASEHHQEAVTQPAPAEPAPQQVAPPQVSTQEIDQAEAAVQKDPQNLQALVTLGNLYFDSHQPQKAIPVYERALAINPKNPDVRTDLGTMYREIKDYDMAVKEFREAAQIDPSHKNSRFNLAIVLQMDKKDIKGAIAAWQDFLRVDPAGQRSAMAKAELDQLKALEK